MGRPVAFDFIARDRDYTRGLNRMERHTTRFGTTVGRIAGTSVRAFGGVGVAAVGLGVAAGVMGVKTAAANEQAEISFRTLLGSGKKAQAFLGQLKSFAAATPFELPGLVDAARGLLGVGVQANKVIPILTDLGDASGALGLDQERFGRVMIAVQQIMASGKVRAGDLLQITEAGIPIWKLLAEATGKPIPVLQKLQDQGKLLSKDVLPALFSQMHKDYGGSMAAQSHTLGGLWSTLMDTLSQGLANVIKPLEPELKTGLTGAITVVQGALKGVSDFLTNTVIPGLKTLKQWWDDNKTSVGALATGLSTVFGPAADDAATSAGGLSTSLGGLKRILDDAATALFYLKLAMLGGEAAMTMVEIGVEDLGIAVGYTINFFDRLSGGSGHAADSMVDDMRTMRDQARDKLKNIRGEIAATQRALDDLHGKNIPVSASLKLNFTKDYTQAMWAADRARAGRMATGGRVGGQGPGGQDNQLRWLAPDEHVWTGREVVAAGGHEAMQRWRKAVLAPGMALGGPVGRIDTQTGAVNKIEAFGTGTRLHAGIAAFLAAFGAGGGGGAFTGGAASGNVIRLALAQARRMAASFKVALALIEAGIVESGLRNLPYGDRDSLGFLQQRPSQGWLHPMNISYAAWDFLRRAIPIQGRYGTAGMLAQAVQRSAFPFRYDAVQSQALGILNAYGYDSGYGVLPPGLSLSWNGTGRAEALGPASAGGIVFEKGAIQVIGAQGMDERRLADLTAATVARALDARDRRARKGPRV